MPIKNEEENVRYQATARLIHSKIGHDAIIHSRAYGSFSIAFLRFPFLLVYPQTFSGVARWSAAKNRTRTISYDVMTSRSICCRHSWKCFDLQNVNAPCVLRTHFPSRFTFILSSVNLFQLPVRLTIIDLSASLFWVCGRRKNVSGVLNVFWCSLMARGFEMGCGELKGNDEEWRIQRFLVMFLRNSWFLVYLLMFFTES
jgi:hypothetical protein